MGVDFRLWRQYVETTGEVSVVCVSESLGIPVSQVLAYAENMHGARYVGGTSKCLIWKEDAARIEKMIRTRRDLID